MILISGKRTEGKTSLLVAWAREDIDNRVILCPTKSQEVRNRLTHPGIKFESNPERLRGTNYEIAIDDLDLFIPANFGKVKIATVTT